jgi:hypothetical protein
LQLILGNEIYEVKINNKNGFDGNTLTMVKRIDPPSGIIEDGHTQVADFNRDGYLDVFISNRTTGGGVGTVHGYVWDVHNNTVSSPFAIPTGSSGQGGKSIPLVADFNKDSIPDVLIQTQLNTNAPVFRAFRYNPSSKSFIWLWDFTPSEDSYSTSATLFDFNLDGNKEIVLQDQSYLRIVNAATGLELTKLSFGAGTVMQFPVVADPYGKIGDRSARIVSIGALNQSGGGLYQGSLNILKAEFGHWAYTRPVWNQIMYNSVNVNDDVSTVRYPVSPATFFPGIDRIIGTADDVQPFNAFLKQMETLNVDGEPLWLAADVTPVDSLSYSAYVDSTVNITLGITNIGDAGIGPKVYVSLYRNSITAVNTLGTDSFDISIQPGDTAIVSISYTDASALAAPYVIVARVNDKYPEFTYWPECDSLNNVINLGLMTKASTLNTVQHNGRYSNPVSVLANEYITYAIRAVNAGGAGVVSITDTLPAYMNYEIGSAVPTELSWTTAGTPPRTTLLWSATVPAGGFMDVSFDAVPVAGACASQPLFLNQAWVLTPDNRLTPTNYTYHQGAGVAAVTFSASLGGSIFGAAVQVVDYRSTARPGVIVAPDSGYVFAGWQHDAYTSLRGDTIPAASGIMQYDALTIHGNVELHAVFTPSETYIPKDNRELEESIELPDNIWSSKNTLYIRTQKSGGIARIYTPAGTLYDQRTVITEGITSIKLPQGVYVVTLNNGTGRKVVISE